MNKELRRQTMVLASILFASSLIIAGCSDDDGSGHADENHEELLDAHACEHIDQASPVTAAATDVDAGDVSDEHTGYLVTLSSYDGGNGGLLTYQASEAGDFGFFLTRDIPIQIFDANGTEVVVEESVAGSGTCDITNVHVAELEVGTYSIALGGSGASADDVGLTIEHVEHDHNEDHDNDHDDHGEDHDDDHHHEAHE